MADEPIDLGAIRKARRLDYVDRRRIAAALSELDAAADEIIAGSVRDFSAVDPLAHEICAYANAIRRAVGIEEE